MANSKSDNSDKEFDKLMDWVLVGALSVGACAVLWQFEGPVYGILCGLLTLVLCYFFFIKKQHP